MAEEIKRQIEQKYLEIWYQQRMVLIPSYLIYLFGKEPT